MMRSLLVSLGLMLVAVLLFLGTMLAVLNHQGTSVSSLLGRGQPRSEGQPGLEDAPSPEGSSGPRLASRPDRTAEPGVAKESTPAPRLELPRLFDLPGAQPGAQGERLPSRLTPEEIDLLAEELRKGRAELERSRQAQEEHEAGLAQREEELLARRREVRALQDQVDRARKELEAARSEWEAQLVTLDASEKKSIKRLADMISEMRPEDAAQTFQRWLPEGHKKIVKVIAAMDPSAAAKVLEKIDPKQAHEIFESLTRYREHQAQPPLGG